MILLPIVERELRVVARRPSTQWVRFFASLLALVVFILFLAASNDNSPQAVGGELFGIMSSVAFMVSILAGVFLTADELSGEKRAGTLGLLFLTDLRGYDVVLGKLMVSSVHAFYALLAVFPVLGIPLLMGGVTGGEFFRVMGALVVTLCFSLAVGLLISALGRETRTVTLGTFLFILLFAAIFPAVYGNLKVLTNMRVPHFLIWLSPGGCLWTAFDDNYARGFFAHEYWVSVIAILGVSVVFISLASFYLPSAWQEKPLTTHRRWGWVEDIQSSVAMLRRWFKRPALRNGDPLVWLGSRDTTERMLAWSAVVLMVPMELCFLFAVCFDVSKDRTMEMEWSIALTVGMVCGFCSHLLLKYLVAVSASRRLCEDRASGALELLLSTPVSEGQILNGLRKAVSRQLFGPIMLVMLANLSLALMTAFFKLDMDFEVRTIFGMMIGGGALTLGMDCWALTGVGQWRGLRARSPNRAVIGAMGPILGMPWLGLALILFSGPNTEKSMDFALTTWIVLSFVVAGMQGSHSRERLSHGIRSAMET